MDGVTPTWDGKNESDNIVEGGAYIYVAEIEFEGDEGSYKRYNGIIVLAK